MKDGNLTSYRRIVAAANRLSNGTIICGVRHWDMIMRLAVAQMIDVKKEGAEQGFVDNGGFFLTREEAWPIAEAAGQLLERAPTGPRGILFSEDVW
ncbi:hypothetical protein JL101_035850 (plasmid) [Skermanella rosea]|uniref:hypothetical protein n=1 Tax=Skermanella rosea TaxID=1817965 RepID=UPI0019331DC1|nr:hypothetical protein [Skermanella rosea]UEM08027.1 hypothetical protein JL101_035850 [Skermanella rosea]